MKERFELRHISWAVKLILTLWIAYGFQEMGVNLYIVGSIPLAGFLAFTVVAFSVRCRLPEAT